MTFSRKLFSTLISATSMCGLILLFPSLSLAFPDLEPPQNGSITCETACHTPENLARAKKDKLFMKECRECHVGETSNKVFSNFHKFRSTILPENRKPNRRVQSIRPPAPAGSPQGKSQSGKGSGKKVEGMVLIEAGDFIMGSNERWDDESPEHINTTGSYWIDLYETTNADYKKFVDATGRPAPHHWPEGQIPKTRETHPVVYVSWFDADAYCKWRGKRLPTEPEWEKASRGVNGNIYPWGNIWTLDKSNNPYKHSTGTEPIGSYPEGRSPYGLYDMSGNVWEWVDAYYLPHPGNTIPKAEYGKDKRVLKGGSWFDCLSYGCGLSAPTFNRSFFNPEVKNNSFGFRCARDP